MKRKLVISIDIPDVVQSEALVDFCVHATVLMKDRIEASGMLTFGQQFRFRAESFSTTCAVLTAQPAPDHNDADGMTPPPQSADYYPSLRKSDE